MSYDISTTSVTKPKSKIPDNPGKVDINTVFVVAFALVEMPFIPKIETVL